MQSKAPASLLDRAKAVLQRDPKRTALMVVLAVVMGILWVRMLVSGPAAATASFIRRSVAVITDSGDSLPKASSSNPVMDWLGQPRQPISRNLFAIHLDYYARSSPRTKSSTWPEDPAKSPTNDADQDKEKQILIDNLQSQISKLKLQTTVMGSTPRALINGELVKEGDTVDGFTVMKIEPRKVTLEQDEVTLEVAMP